MKTYKEELEALSSKFNNDKKDLITRFAFANNKVKKGDIVTKRGGLNIVVEKIQASLNYGSEPCLVFSGVWMTKKGHKNKRNKKAVVYSGDLE